MISEVESKVLDIIENSRDDIIEFLRRLIRARSDNPPGLYEEVSRVVMDEFEKLGFEVEVIEVPMEIVKSYGLETRRINVLGWIRGDGKTTIALQPHLDVVPPGEGWKVDPFGAEIIDDWIYGRGAADCKGSLAAYTYAAAALREAGVKINGNLVVVGSVDEETGGFLGAKYLLDKGYIHADMAIVEGGTYSIRHATNGCLWMKVTSIGKTAHASSPENGIDAIRKMHLIMTTLYEYQNNIRKRKCSIEGIDHPTMVITMIKGGMKENVVCDKCEIRFDRRITPEENPEEVEEELINLLKNLMKVDSELNIKWERLLLAKPAGPTPMNSPLITALKNAGRKVLNEELPVKGMTGFADSRFYWEKGIPFVHYGAGPRDPKDARAHGPNERIKIEDLINGTKVLAIALLNLIGPK